MLCFRWLWTLGRKTPTKRTKLIDRIAADLLTEAEAAISLANLRSEIDSANAALSSIESRLKVKPAGDIEATVKSVVSLFASLKFKLPEQRKTAISAVVQEIHVNSEKQAASLRLKTG